MDFKTILCEDSIIADITDNLTVCVESSGATVNYKQYASNTASNSQISYQCQIPNQETVVNRYVQ